MHLNISLLELSLNQHTVTTLFLLHIGMCMILKKLLINSSMEKDIPYFITYTLVRLIIDFNVPVPRGNDRHSFLKRRKED